MKLPKQNTSKRTRWIVAVVVVALAAVGVVGYAVFWQNKPAQHTTPSSDHRAEITRNSERGNTNSHKANNQREKEKATIKQYEGESPDDSQSLTGSINYKNIVADELILRVTIDQSLSSGSCQLRLTNAGKTLTKTALVIPNPSSSSCQGFNVPVSELGSGAWQIEITVSSGDRSGTIVSSITI